MEEDATPKVRYQGELRPYEMPPGKPYGHFPHHFIADFDDFNRPGRYRLRLSNGVISTPFSIGNDLVRTADPTHADLLFHAAVRRCLREVARRTATRTMERSLAGRATGSASMLAEAGTMRATI